MLLSRCSNVLRAVKTVKHLRAMKNVVPNGGQTRLSHILRYREAFDAPKFYRVAAEFYGGFFWWWVLWHIYHEPAHLLGEWDVPEAENWTDEELGIPPDYDC